MTGSSTLSPCFARRVAGGGGGPRNPLKPLSSNSIIDLSALAASLSAAGTAHSIVGQFVTTPRPVRELLLQLRTPALGGSAAAASSAADTLSSSIFSQYAAGSMKHKSPHLSVPVSLSEAGPAAAAIVDLPSSLLLEENCMRQAAKRECYIELAGLFATVCVGCSF